MGLDTREKQFLLEFADLIERHGGVDFYYTKYDDGIHIRLGGSDDDCFVDYGFDPQELRATAAERTVGGV